MIASSKVKDHIRAYWGRVSDYDLEAGQAAYPAYLHMMDLVSGHYGFSLENTTEAFVALSPNNDYYGNLRSLTSVCNGVQNNERYTVSTYKACAQRAETYLRGEVDFLSTVKGKKIRAFRDNILHQEASKEFVLDGHMIAIAVGQKLTMKEAQKHVNTRTYEIYSDEYRSFAEEVGLPVHVMQATLWHCRKRTESIKFSTQRDLFRDDFSLYYTIEEIPPYWDIGGPINE